MAVGRGRKPSKRSLTRSPKTKRPKIKQGQIGGTTRKQTDILRKRPVKKRSVLGGGERRQTEVRSGRTPPLQKRGGRGVAKRRSFKRFT